MASAKVLYAVRLPSDLKRLLDAAAVRQGVKTTELVIAALWRSLESPSRPVNKPIQTPADRVPIARASDRKAALLASLSGLGLTTAGRMDDHPEELRGDDVAPVESEPDVLPANRCTTKDQDAAGDWFRCTLCKGHKGAHKPSTTAEDA